MAKAGQDQNAASRAAQITDLAERTRRLVDNFVENQQLDESFRIFESLDLAPAFAALCQRMMADPARLAEAQTRLLADYVNLGANLWLNSMARLTANTSPHTGEPDPEPAPEQNPDQNPEPTPEQAQKPDQKPLIEPESHDRRFRDADWDENLIFDYIKQSYLLSSRWICNAVRDVEGLDEKTARKVDFYARQFVDALSPTNFMLTNPEVLRETVARGGENLLDGLANLLDDLERGGGKLAIRMTDANAFEVGGNIAITPGKVVFQNDLMQLIQYAPTTETVHKRPLLIIPPWINKFYILDLRADNSFIRWAVGEGLTVFVISWVNPDQTLARKRFEDYMHEGPLAALDAIDRALGEPEVNIVGYCIGGTLTAATLAWMRAKDREAGPENASPSPSRVRSATFLTTMLDFEESGDLGVFVDEKQLNALEERMNRDGYLDSSDMVATFNMLRANDLIWSCVVNNYLLGREPFPFDLLYWNADATRMPARMHAFCLRAMYYENRLVEPGGIILDGVPIDLGLIDMPTFMLSTREDHIAPWTSTWQAMRVLAGPVRFCLSSSGHVAGVINPPMEPPKYGYYINRKGARPKAGAGAKTGAGTGAGRATGSPEKWLAGADWHDGSWWPEWKKWLTRHAGPRVPARIPGTGALPALEDAPGSYVRIRADA